MFAIGSRYMYQSILFVCTGNICRSPTADGMLRQKLREAGLSHIMVDSAGTHGYHSGEGPDGRAVAEAARRGYDISGIISRPLKMQDYMEFDLLVAMDEGHLAYMERQKPAASNAAIRLHSEFARNPTWLSVPDPYYGGEEHFRKAFDLIEQGVEGILREIQEK